MTEQRVSGNSNVQIQSIVGSRIGISYGGATRAVPLEPAKTPFSRPRSAAGLIRANASVIPYVDRGGLVGELEAWIDSPSPFSGLLISGRSGSGKTRLAVELCQRLEGSGWLCGFLSAIADREMLEALVEVPTARLVVIDYAETRPEQLELLLPLLRANATAESPVRTLLLVRGDVDLGDRGQRLAHRIEAVDAVLDECEFRRLEDAPFDEKERHSLFKQAVLALGAGLDSDMEPADPPDLSQNAFESPLMVVTAAYLAGLGERASTTREALLDEVLAHERRYWLKGTVELGVDDVLAERLVAIATLLGANDEDQAANHLCLLAELGDATAERRYRLARWVHGLYSGPAWWNPLEPDAVGERLVARCFSDQPNVLREALATDSPEEITRPLEVLSRASVDNPQLAKTVGSILNEKLGNLCKVAVAQAQTIRDVDLLYGKAVTVAAAVNAALSTVEIGSEVLTAALDLMPPRADLVLNELAATLSARDVERLRPLAAADPATHAPELASALSNLSVRLSNAGRHPEALEASEEAVAIWRPLVETDPDAHTPELAIALNNLSARLSNAGRRLEALEASKEAMAIRRPLAAADPATHAPELASALNNLSLRLADIGRHPEALEAGEEAVATYRPLAEANPAAHAPELAMALNNLSARLADIGRHPEALEASEEAVATYRPLAEANPAAHAPELAIALNNLSARLSNAGRHPEALEASEEGVAIWRPLAEANPAAFAPYLASALNNLSLRLSSAARHPEALEASEEAVATLRPLVEANSAAFAPSLASALNNLSAEFSSAGRHPEALGASEEAVATLRPLAEAYPAAFAPSLAKSLSNLANRFRGVGSEDEADGAEREAVELMQLPDAGRA